MIVAAPDGRHITVRRVWLPWRLKRRKFENPDPLIFLDAADDPASLVMSLVLGIAAALFGGIILAALFFAGEAILLLLALVPILIVARVLWVLPWVLEASYGDTVLGLDRVRGWRDSEGRLREIANAYRLGQDPFRVADPPTP